eukprot:Hpha_TRINITY_DN16531_c2_g1::TRINITY_DN16531_c2_g1_i1::g.136327::m.136327
MPVPRRASPKAPPGVGDSGSAATSRRSGSSLASLCAWDALPPSSDQDEKGSGRQMLRNKHSTVAYNGMVVVFGGHDLHANRFLDDVIVYDTDAERWFTPPCTGQRPCPRRAHSAALVGSVMIVCGGFAGNGCDNDVCALDLDTWVWSRLKVDSASVPCPRGGHSAVVHDGVMYIHGGWDTTPAYHCDVWAFRCDLARGLCWWDPVEVKSEFVPPARVGHRAAMVGEEMLVTGGFGDDKYWNDVNALDLRTFEWRRVVPAVSNPGPCTPRPRTYHSMEAKDGKLLLVGGSDHNGEMADVWVFDVAGCRWKEVHCGGLTEGRFAHTSCTVGSDILIFAGISVSARAEGGGYEENTDLVKMTVEDWVVENTLQHTLRRLVVQNPGVLTGSCQLMPRPVIDSLLSYIDRFPSEALPKHNALRDALTVPPPSVSSPPSVPTPSPSPPRVHPEPDTSQDRPRLKPHLILDPTSVGPAAVAAAPAAGRLTPELLPADAGAAALHPPLSPGPLHAAEPAVPNPSGLSSSSTAHLYPAARCASTSGGSSSTSLYGALPYTGVRSGSGSSDDSMHLPTVAPTRSTSASPAAFPATRPASRSGSASSLGDGSVGYSVPSRSVSGGSAVSNLTVPPHGERVVAPTAHPGMMRRRHPPRSSSPPRHTPPSLQGSGARPVLARSGVPPSGVPPRYTYGAAQGSSGPLRHGADSVGVSRSVPGRPDAYGRSGPSSRDVGRVTNGYGSPSRAIAPRRRLPPAPPAPPPPQRSLGFPRHRR